FGKYYCHFYASVGQVPLFKVLCAAYAVRIKQEKALEKLFLRLEKSFKRTDVLSPLQTKSIFFELLYMLLGGQLDQIQYSPTPSMIKWNEILQYVEESLPRAESIELIAKKFNYSPKYFFRYF